jgi:hypothetical protein
MHQPRLMKLNLTDTDENDLSSDVVSITLAYFLKSPYPSLKYGIQFLLIKTTQNLLRDSKTDLRQPPECVHVFL